MYFIADITCVIEERVRENDFKVIAKRLNNTDVNKSDLILLYFIGKIL